MGESIAACDTAVERTGASVPDGPPRCRARARAVGNEGGHRSRRRRRVGVGCWIVKRGVGQRVGARERERVRRARGERGEGSWTVKGWCA